DRVAVIGCGGVGLAGIAVLRARGVKNIVACDIDPAKLATAKELGAKETIDTRSSDAAQKLAGIAGAIDFVGTPATAALGIAALRKGGRYVLVGLHGGELVHPLPPIAQRAIGIVGSYVGNLQELKEVVALAKSGKLKALPVHTRPAAAVISALEDLKGGKALGCVRNPVGWTAAARAQRLRALARRMDAGILRRKDGDAASRLEHRHRAGLRLGVDRAPRKIRQAALRAPL